MNVKCLPNYLLDGCPIVLTLVFIPEILKEKKTTQKKLIL